MSMFMTSDDDLKEEASEIKIEPDLTAWETTEENEPFGHFSLVPRFVWKFKVAKLRHGIEQVLFDELNGKEYTPKDADLWTEFISIEIRNIVKSMGFEKYKFIVQVTIGEMKNRPGISMVNRCLWDEQTDNSTCYTHVSKHLVCVVNVFGVFFY